MLIDLELGFLYPVGDNQGNDLRCNTNFIAGILGCYTSFLQSDY